MRGSRLEDGWRDRERQRQDHDPRLRPTKPERSGSVVRKRPRPRAHQERTMLNSSGRHPRGHLRFLPKLEARRQARLHSIMPSTKVSAGWTVWKPASSAKVGEEGDSRVERSIGCSLCRSVADVGKDASSQAGRSRPQGRERRRRVSSTRRLHVDHGGAARSGRKGAGCSRANVTVSTRLPAPIARSEVFYQRKTSWFRCSSSP